MKEKSLNECLRWSFLPTHVVVAWKVGLPPAPKEGLCSASLLSHSLAKALGSDRRFQC
jgi:hypothetical protein